MFDTLICNHELMPAEHRGKEFQTKDLECELHLYEITEEGRLVVNVREGTYHFDETAFFGLRFEHTGDRREVLEDYHGDILFYRDVATPEDNPLYVLNLAEGTTGIVGDGGVITPHRFRYIHFRARFTEGVLSSLIEVPDPWG